jgi:type II secretory pathway component PulC
MTQKAFSPGWDEARVRKVLAHYESQSEEEAVAEDEAAAESISDTAMTVPKALVPAVRELIAKHQRRAGGSDSG